MTTSANFWCLLYGVEAVEYGVDLQVADAEQTVSDRGRLKRLPVGA